jgi:hypothetical protein
MSKFRKFLAIAVAASALLAPTSVQGLCWFCHYYLGVGWVCETQGAQGEQGWTYCYEQIGHCGHNNDVCYAR